MRNVCIFIEFDFFQSKLILEEVIRALNFSQIHKFNYFDLNNISHFMFTKILLFVEIAIMILQVISNV